MSVLLDLQPRVSGTRPVEPVADFGAARRANLHEPAFCAVTVALHTYFCAEE